MPFLHFIVFFTADALHKPFCYLEEKENRQNNDTNKVEKLDEFDELEDYIKEKIRLELFTNKLPLSILDEMKNLLNSKKETNFLIEEALLEFGEKIALLMHINNQATIISSDTRCEKFFQDHGYNSHSSSNQLFLHMIGCLNITYEIFSFNHIQIVFQQQNIANYFIVTGIFKKIINDQQDLSPLSSRNFVEDYQLMRLCTQFISRYPEKLVPRLTNLSFISSLQPEKMVPISKNLSFITDLEMVLESLLSVSEQINVASNCISMLIGGWYFHEFEVP